MLIRLAHGFLRRVQPLSREKKLALLLLLTGCASTPTLGRPRGYWQDRPALATDFSAPASAEQQAVSFDVEAVSPAQTEELRRRGVTLPQVSQKTADPRTHHDFVDARVTAVGFGITEGGYLLFCDGLRLPVLVPESQVDLELTVAAPLNVSIYPDREAALADITASVAPSRRSETYAFYRGAGNALIAPTLFSPATTPRIAQTMLAVRRDLSRTVERDLKVLLLNLAGTKVLSGVFSLVVRAGSGPAPWMLPQNENLAGEVRAPRQPLRGPAETTEVAAARGTEPPQPRSYRVTPQQGTAGNPRASSRALKATEAEPEAPLPATQQHIRDVLLKEHPDLHPRVATEAARGGETAQGPGGSGADVPLLNGGGREVSVHHGEFTVKALGGHLVKKASQGGTTEIYLQIDSPGASREAFLKLVPKLRSDYGFLQGQFVRVFGPDGESWWSGVFRGPG